MKGKKKRFTGLLVLALCLIGVMFAARNAIPKRTLLAVMGLAGTLTAVSIPQLLNLHEEDENPRVRKRNRIVQEDERNAAIRNRAKAISGDVLQWGLVGVVWLAVGLGAPWWVVWSAAAAFGGKFLLETCLAAHYQKEM